jgi:hypothetical protein
VSGVNDLNLATETTARFTTGATVMTAAQLARLAEQAAYAADFYSQTNPASARTFANAALVADRLSADLQRGEELARIGTDLAAVKAELGMSV